MTAHRRHYPGGTAQPAARIFKTVTAAELDATEASDDTRSHSMAMMPDGRGRYGWDV